MQRVSDYELREVAGCIYDAMVNTDTELSVLTYKCGANSFWMRATRNINEMPRHLSQGSISFGQLNTAEKTRVLVRRNLSRLCWELNKLFEGDPRFIDVPLPRAQYSA